MFNLTLLHLLPISLLELPAEKKNISYFISINISSHPSVSSLTVLLDLGMSLEGVSVLSLNSHNPLWSWHILFSEIKYSWVFNGQRSFPQQDTRRFISQRTGNLYIAKVEASDAGNYTCAVRNVMTNATVFSSPTPVVVRRDGKQPGVCLCCLWLSCSLGWFTPLEGGQVWETNLESWAWHSLFFLFDYKHGFALFKAPALCRAMYAKSSLSAWGHAFT